MSKERVELTIGKNQASAELFLGDHPITSCTVLAIEGDFRSGTEGVVMALLGLVKHVLKTKPPSVEIRIPNIIRLEDLPKGDA